MFYIKSGFYKNGFYCGIFYPWNDHTIDNINGSCFEKIGKPENYNGFLFETSILLSDNIFYS